MDGANERGFQLLNRSLSLQPQITILATRARCAHPTKACNRTLTRQNAIINMIDDNDWTWIQMTEYEWIPPAIPLGINESICATRLSDFVPKYGNFKNRPVSQKWERKEAPILPSGRQTVATPDVPQLILICFRAKFKPEFQKNKRPRGLGYIPGLHARGYMLSLKVRWN